VLLGEQVEILTFIKFMEENGIIVNQHYFPLHMSSLHSQGKNHDAAFPCATSFQKRLIRLPLHANLTDEDVDKVVKCLLAFFKSKPAN